MSKFLKHLSILLVFNILSFSLYAQNAISETNKVVPSLWEQIDIVDKILILIAIGLLIPIYYLSKIFNWSLRHYLKKRLESNSVKTIIGLSLFIIPTLLTAQQTSTVSPVSIFDHFNFLRWFLLAVILTEAFVLGFFGYMLFQQFALFEGVQSEKETKQSWLSEWWEKVNNFGSIEEETKIDLGHNYDGIRELDNNIPAWFSASFVICILFAIIYLWRYHVAEISPLSAQEYQIEEEEAELAHQLYLKMSGSGIDENKIELSTDKTDIAEGKKMYLANCATCHIADGGGQAGPNLTDNSWINGCTPKDIYQSIKYGRKNGMMAWKDNFSDKQIIQLASFVKTLQGTKPAAPKPAQGEICSISSPIDSNAKIQANFSKDSITKK